MEDMQQLSVSNGVESSWEESHEMVTENERKTQEKARVVLSVKTFSNCANDEETIAESSKSMSDGKLVADFNGNVVESGSENTDFDASVQSEHPMVERSENTDSNHSVVKEKDDIVNSEGLTTSEVSVTLHNKEETDGVSSEVGSELYYVIGTPISHPKEDPKTENLN